MADFANGFTLKTKKFKTVKIIKKLGEGGQGAVYRVDYDGQVKAFKWYTAAMKDPKKFYQNLEKNVEKGPPAKSFLWPEDITEWDGKGSFGYVMDIRPPEYEDFAKFILAKVKFSGATARVNAALNITEGFAELHRKGFSYQDLNDGNFFINPKNGDVLICDNDNVSPYGEDSGIAGKAKYMAPEIVRNEKKPYIMTDRYSLAVVLFLLFCGNHPLEGKASNPVVVTPKLERLFHGEKPVFIMDGADDSNRPVPGLHRNVINKWPYLPGYIKEAFIATFSKKALLEDPAARLNEQEWLWLLIRMRGAIFKCSCGEIYFVEDGKDTSCPSCKKKNLFDFIKTRRYVVPVHGFTRLYACHTENDSDDFKTTTGSVSAAGGGFALGNLSKKPWNITVDGNASAVGPNQGTVLKKGMSINFGGGSAEII
jgi:serine/threonine protein kinase